MDNSNIDSKTHLENTFVTLMIPYGKMYYQMDTTNWKQVAKIGQKTLVWPHTLTSTILSGEFPNRIW